MKRYILLASLLVTLPAMAEVTVPNTFVPDTPAVASEVNENFRVLENAINARPRVVGNDGVTEVGTLLTPEGIGVAVVTDKGYMIRGLQTRTGKLREIELVFSSSDCTGQAFVGYTEIGNGSVFTNQEVLYYIDYLDEAQALVVKSIQPTNPADPCYSVPDLQLDNSFPVKANEPSVTGIENAPTGLAPFTIQSWKR